MEDGFSHTPVLLEETVEALAVNPGGVYLDGTAGGGGHSFEIAKRLAGGRLFCLDKDPEAVEAASSRLLPFAFAEVIEGDFREAAKLLSGKTDGLDGALLDLGVSSRQLDSAPRGFSYNSDGALDMRMSRRGISAADIVNTYDETELSKLLRTLGEEKYAALIASRIVRERQKKPFETTAELASAVASALPAAVRRKEKNPARQTFLALRVAVNDEYEALSEGMSGIFEMLRPGGRFCVITFHSIEDRLVKRFFSSLTRGCECPPDFPVCVCGKMPRAKLIGKKPVTAAEEELRNNRRARSAKLRILEKL